MIQALGTLKLIKDIEEKKVAQGFKFTQDWDFEEIDNINTNYTKIDSNSKDENHINQLLISHWKEQMNQYAFVFIFYTVVSIHLKLFIMHNQFLYFIYTPNLYF